MNFNVVPHIIQNYDILHWNSSSLHKSSQKKKKKKNKKKHKREPTNKTIWSTLFQFNRNLLMFSMFSMVNDKVYCYQVQVSFSNRCLKFFLYSWKYLCFRQKENKTPNQILRIKRINTFVFHIDFFLL